MNWEWSYLIAIAGTITTIIPMVFSFLKEKQKGEVDLLTVSHSSAIQMLQAAREREANLQEDLRASDDRYEAERKRRRECEDLLAERDQAIKVYVSQIKELLVKLEKLEGKTDATT